MQIYGPSHVHGAQPLTGPHTARSVSPGTSAGSSPIGDSLDISEAGQIAGRLAEIPEIRADRVDAIRAEIASGTYETDEKLDIALSRLLDELA